VQTVQLRVPTIKCEGCVEKIRETLVKLPDVVLVEGDPQTKHIVVTMRDGRGSVAAIEDALTRIVHVVGEK
jgi:copper chaperone CopZ